MKIEIITTKNNELKETGFGALGACENVLKSINLLGHEVSLNVCTEKSDLDEVIQKEAGLVILAVKYLSQKGRNGIWPSEYLGKMGLNYSGSCREVLKFDSDKSLAKNQLRNQNIKTANFFSAIPGDCTCEDDLPLDFPLFLKPIDAANGNGIDDLSLVKNFQEYESKIKSLFAIYKQPILIEEYLDGREFTVSIIEVENSKLFVAAVEIIPNKSLNGLRILGHVAKTDNLEVIKKISDTELTKKVKNIAIKSFFNLGARDFGRIDIKANQKEECFFMEANLVPGMTKNTSYFPRAFEVEYGTSYDEVIKLIIQQGLNRISL